MVGRKDITSVSVAVTSVGQVTLPKAFRDALGITDQVDITRRGEEIIVKKARTDDEIFADLRAMQTTVQKERIRANAGKTANELIKESLETPEGREIFRKTFMGGLKDEK